MDLVMNLKVRQRFGSAWLTLMILELGISAAVWADSPKPQQLSVDQAIRIAMENSLQRRLAQNDVKVARDKLAQAVSAYGPKLTLEGNYYHYNEVSSSVRLAQGLVDLSNTVTGSRQGGPDDGLNYYGYKLHLEQPLYTGNKLTAAKKRAEANRDDAKSGLNAADNDLTLDVKKAFYSVLQIQRQEQTMEEAVASMENHLREADAYFKANLVPKLDVMRAEVKLADLKQQQVLAKNNLKLAKSTFNFILGVDLGVVYVLEDQMKYGPLPNTLESCKNEALSNRPELAAANAKVEMARQAVELAKSGNKPTVALVADKFHTDPNDQSPSLTYGVVAQLKIFDNGLVKHQIAAAEDNWKQAVINQELVQRNIKLEVEQAYCDVEAALETIDVAQKSLAHAQETLDMAQTRYKVGLSSSLERIDAELGLTQAKSNYTQTLSMYNIALARLDRAMGDKIIVSK
jgi:outer membrane protein